MRLSMSMPMFNYKKLVFLGKNTLSKILPKIVTGLILLAPSVYSKFISYFFAMAQNQLVN